MIGKVLLTLGLGALAAGCSSSSRPAPEPVLWSDPATELPSGPLIDDLPWLAQVSAWSSPGCGVGQEDRTALLGDFGVGNGRVFALSGYTCPPNTLHTMIGPTYQPAGSAFFDDTASWLARGGQALALTEGQVFRVEGADMLVTRARSEEVDLLTVTFAPRLPDPADPAHRAMVRLFSIHNRGAAVLDDLTLVTDPGMSLRDGRTRRFAVLAPAGAADPLTVPLGPLGPGEERRVLAAYLFGLQGEDDASVEQALIGHGAEALLAATRGDWAAYMDQAARLETPDPRVNQLYTGLLVTVRTQQAQSGGVSPMSRYSRIWTRDCVGPLRLWLRVGMFDEARRLMEYYHLAAVSNGDIANSYRLDCDPAAAPPEPDWASMGPFSGRAQAEAPSYIPLMARWFALATGEHDLVARWYPFFARALAGQLMNEDGLLSFSGDETYRAAMSIANGWHLEHPYQECCLSANSSFLYVAAAEALASEAAATGLEAEAQAWARAAAEARQAAEAAYWIEDGFWRTLIDPAQPELIMAPYEDVATKPIWTGYVAPDDPKAVANLSALADLAMRADGLMVSPIHPDYEGIVGALLGVDVNEGVYTGMNPGYGLANLALTDHPMAEAAFNALGRVPSPSGNMAEYMVYDDHAALIFLYDPSGEAGDYTARYRPWEGGILADAMLLYLSGFEPDAPAGRFRIAPRLPNHWPSMRLESLRVGQSRFDLQIERQGATTRVTVGPTDQGSWAVDLSLPLGDCEAKAVRVNGQRVDHRIWGPFGQTRVQLTEALSIGPDQTFEAEVRCPPR